MTENEPQPADDDTDGHIMPRAADDTEDVEGHIMPRANDDDAQPGLVSGALSPDESVRSARF